MSPSEWESSDAKTFDRWVTQHHGQTDQPPGSNAPGHKGLILLFQPEGVFWQYKESH
jgi:hypothetical protein